MNILGFAPEYSRLEKAFKHLLDWKLSVSVRLGVAMQPDMASDPSPFLGEGWGEGFRRVDPICRFCRRMPLASSGTHRQEELLAKLGTLTPGPSPRRRGEKLENQSLPEPP
jgi:hypothetical protein